MHSQQASVILDDNNAYKVHCTDWGDSNAKKVLVCVHGLTRNCRDFDYIAKELSSSHGYRVLSIDMPGRGRSQYLPDSQMYIYKNYCLVVLALLNQLKLTSVDYLGTSMGGILAIYLSQENPNLFRNLILNDVGTFLPKDSIARIGRYVRVYPSFTDVDHAKNYLKVKLAHFGIKNEQDWDYITNHSIHANDMGDLVLDYDIGITDGLFKFSTEVATDIDYSHLWPGVHCENLLLLRGSKSEVLLHDTALVMLSTKNNSSFIEFEGVGHAPALMEEDQIKSVVDWLISKA
jgi:pimeloyl-ACP methyl ester carboxylesterase